MRKIFILKNDHEPKITKKEYLAPSYIFIPIKQRLIKKVNINDKVLKGEFLSTSDYSSVSGIIKGSKVCKDITKNVNTLAILNDYKEQRVRKGRKNSINKLDEILDKNILNKLQKGQKNLVITCFADEPYNYNTRYYISENYHEILDAIDFIKSSYNFNKVYIIVKDNEKNSIEKFIKVIGNYPEISFITIPNVYPIKNTDYIEKFLNIKDACILSFMELYKIFHVVEFGVVNSETYITINMDDKSALVIKTKIGALVTELLNNLKINYQDYFIYLNGVIGGSRVKDLNNIIISDNLESICFTKKEVPIPQKCIKCGSCYRHCPKGIDPCKIINNKSDKSNTSSCLDCGLCNYICPSFIDLRRAVREDKK